LGPDFGRQGSLFYFVNEAHRLLLGLSSDLDKHNPHSKNCNGDSAPFCEAFTEVPPSIPEYSGRFAACLPQLTKKSQVLSYPWGWFGSRENRAVQKAVQTVYLALDQFQAYIAMRPYEKKNYEMATILLNAILETTGLPCLSMDFVEENLDGAYAQPALGTNMESLLVNTLKQLIEALQRVPVVYSEGTSTQY